MRAVARLARHAARHASNWADMRFTISGFAAAMLLSIADRNAYGDVTKDEWSSFLSSVKAQPFLVPVFSTT